MTYNAQDISRIFERYLLSHLAGYHVRWVDSIGSTNTQLLNWVRTDPDWSAPYVFGAQTQYAARGRMGRRWCSLEPNDGLLFSCAFDIDQSHELLPSLTPLIGMQVVQYLRTMLPSDKRHRLSLKWPNDVVYDGAKLCGILVEVAKPIKAKTPNHQVIVIGLGMNVQHASHLTQTLGRPITDWGQIVGNSDLSLDDLFEFKTNMVLSLPQLWRKALKIHAQVGFSYYQKVYQSMDYLFHQSIQLILDGQVIAEGQANGVDEMGRLKVQTPTGEFACVSGEVSVRGKK